MRPALLPADEICLVERRIAKGETIPRKTTGGAKRMSTLTKDPPIWMASKVTKAAPTWVKAFWATRRMGVATMGISPTQNAATAVAV